MGARLAETGLFQPDDRLGWRMAPGTAIEHRIPGEEPYKSRVRLLFRSMEATARAGFL